MFKISIFKNFRQIFGAFLFSYGLSSVFFTDILLEKKQDGSTSVPRIAREIMRDHEDTRAFFNYERNEFEHPVEHLNAFINFEFGNIWPVLHKPSNCTRIHRFNQTTVLIGVKSHPLGIEKRNLIRRTWSQARYWTRTIFGKTPIQLKTIFLVGTTPDSNLIDESQEYNDIYQWDFTEDLFNLTIKDHQLITFFENQCEFANFIIKADDDIFLNPKVIQRLIVKNIFDPKRAVNGTYRNFPAGQLVTYSAPVEMFGSMVIGAKPFRDPLNKYFIPNSFYSDAFGEYPKYFSGALFVMTNRALSQIGPKARETPAFPIDDVWVGMVLERAGLDNHLNHEFLMYIGLMNEQEMNEANLNNTCYLAGMPTYHRLTLEVIEMTYKMIYSMNLEKCMDESILSDVVRRFYKKSQFIARELIQEWCSNIQFHIGNTFTSNCVMKSFQLLIKMKNFGPRENSKGSSRHMARQLPHDSLT